MNQSIIKVTLIFLLFGKIDGIAQIGINTNNPSLSSVLDLSSTSKGFLVPRMSSGQRLAIPDPAIGLQVYDIDTKSVWQYNGSHWSSAYMKLSFDKIVQLPNPQVGDMVFDTTNETIRIYLSGKWLAINTNAPNTETLSTFWRNGGSSGESGKAVSVDETGNIYVAGSASFSGGLFEGVTLSAGIFVAKYNSAGVFQWVKSHGGNLGIQVNDICLGTNGNIFITGNFTNTVNFYGTGNTIHTTITSVGGQDLYVAKLNTIGETMWVLANGSIGNETGNALEIDNSGNLLMAGNFENSLTFTGVTNRTFNSAGASDALWIKLNSINGNILDGKKMGGTSYDYLYDLKLDPSNNICVIGLFTGTVTISGSSFSSAETKAFFAQFLPNGNDNYAIDIDITIGNGCLAINAQGDIIIAGTFFGTSTIGSEIFSAIGKDVALAKFLGADGTFIWAKQITGPGDETAEGLTINALNEIFLTGFFSGGSIAYNNTTIQGGILGRDAYFFKANSLGIPLLSSRLYSDNTATGLGEWPHGIAVAANGTVYITGSFHETTNYGINSSSTSAGGQDYFLWKISTY